ncbi:MAG: hypothetical protein WBQ39_09655 [Terriglobales bacterium]
MSNHVARNIAADHASRHMRKRQRNRWNDDDRAVCIDKYKDLVTAGERAEFERRFAEAERQKQARQKAVRDSIAALPN